MTTLRKCAKCKTERKLVKTTLTLTVALGASNVHTHISYTLTHTPNDFSPGWREIISVFVHE